MENQVKKPNKSVVCKSCNESGLRMVEISFLASMKTIWLRKLNEKSSLKDFILTLNSDLGKLNVFGGEFFNVVMQRIHNLFWRDVLRQYK